MSAVDIAVFSVSALTPASLATSSSFASSVWISEAEMTCQSAGTAKVIPAVGALTLA